MKQSPKMKHIQENMKPGVITINGFLGDDKRDLIEILDNDNSLVREMKLTHGMIADKMQEFRDKGEKGLGEFIDIEPHFEVRVISIRGGIRCPFEDGGLIKKYNITVRNLKLDEEINYTDLNIHFIREHGFYQGRGALYRLNPESLVRILEIEHRD